MEMFLKLKVEGQNKERAKRAKIFHTNKAI
jgi:hypothetical protein